MPDEEAQEMPEAAKLNGWTVKGVPYEAREEFNAAAKRAMIPVGEWLILAGREKIGGERVKRAPAPHPFSGPLGVPTIADLAVLMRELPGLSNTKGCTVLAFKVRKIVAAGLADYLPPLQPRLLALPGGIGGQHPAADDGQLGRPAGRANQRRNHRRIGSVVPAANDAEVGKAAAGTV